MLSKKDVKQGSVVPLYRDSQNQTGFMGMAILVSNTGYFTHFIKQEKDAVNISNKLSKGQYVWHYRNKWRLCKIKDLDSDSITIQAKERDGNKLSALLKVFKPFGGDVRNAIAKKSGIVYEGKSYIVHNDTPDFTEVCTQKNFMEEDCSELFKIDKPFDYMIEGYDPQSSICKTEKWVVDMLANPFYGSLSVGQQVYYLDKGLATVHSKENGKLKIKLNKDIIKVDTADLYYEEHFSRRTQANVSYISGITSRHYNSIGKKDSSSNDIREDFDWGL